MQNRLSYRVIGAAIEVHRQLGPGLLESVYQRCLEIELQTRGIPFRREAPLPLFYKGQPLDVDYRVDFLVAGELMLKT